ncbi:MAG: cyclase family protein [Clostridia bacterium]|nr:cyclase family protein [Clostridia bacterium]
MKIHDISRDLVTAPIYPGDPNPKLTKIADLENGDYANISHLSACLHSGTHLDAPLHFYANGDDIASIDLHKVIGECMVIEWDGVMLGTDAEKLLPRLDHQERVLFKGTAQLTQSAAFVWIDAGVKLIGVEGTSVAVAAETATVHRDILSSGALILEGLDLSDIPMGRYFLFAAPIKIENVEGAPVRALLIER